MKALSRFATVLVLGAAFAASLAACGSDATDSGGGAGAPGAAGMTAAAGGGAVPPGDAAKGAALYASTMVGCNACHGANAEGGQSPNITLSMTAGIGSWTYAEFSNAIRKQTGKGGEKLCMFMPIFEEKDLSTQGIADIYAFLKSKPIIDTKNQGTLCP